MWVTTMRGVILNAQIMHLLREVSRRGAGKIVSLVHNLQGGQTYLQRIHRCEHDILLPHHFYSHPVCTCISLAVSIHHLC